MRVLVTGATGLVGSHTVRALLASGHSARALVRNPRKADNVFGRDPAIEMVVGDVTDAQAVTAALAGVDAVVHCAAVVSTATGRAREVIAVNQRATELVVAGAVDHAVAVLVYISSLTVLFRPGRPFDNAHLATEPRGVYARSKLEAEKLVRQLQDSGAPICVLYPPGVIGPDDPGLSEGNRAVRALLTQLMFDTETGFEAIDARDLAAVIVAMLDAGHTGRHIVAGRYLRWPKLIGLFDELTGRRVRRLQVSGAALRRMGRLGDRLNSFVPFDFPLSSEAMAYGTQWPVAEASPVIAATGAPLRTVRQTYADTIDWLFRAGHITASQGGHLAVHS